MSGRVTPHGEPGLADRACSWAIVLTVAGFISQPAVQPEANPRTDGQNKRKHQNMNHRMNINLVTRSVLALALALTIWSPVRAHSAEPAEGKMKDGKMMMEGKMMTGTDMMQRCQAMKEQKEKMMADMKAQDTELTAQIATLNGAPDDKKLRLVAAIVTQLVEQRTARHARMEGMQAGMMQHMMQHMQMGTESLAQCPMMKGMKSTDEKPADAHKEHQAVVK